MQQTSDGDSCSRGLYGRYGGGVVTEQAPQAGIEPVAYRLEGEREIGTVEKPVSIGVFTFARNVEQYPCFALEQLPVLLIVAYEDAGRLIDN